MQVVFKREAESDYYGLTVEGTLVADGSSPDVSYCVVDHCGDTGILSNGSDWGEVSGCTVRENKNGIRFVRQGWGLLRD